MGVHTSWKKYRVGYRVGGREGGREGGGVGKDKRKERRGREKCRGKRIILLVPWLSQSDQSDFSIHNHLLGGGYENNHLCQWHCLSYKAKRAYFNKNL